MGFAEIQPAQAGAHFELHTDRSVAVRVGAHTTGNPDSNIVAGVGHVPMFLVFLAKIPGFGDIARKLSHWNGRCAASRGGALFVFHDQGIHLPIASSADWLRMHEPMMRIEPA